MKTPVRLRTYGIVILGVGILSFGLYNVHSQCAITEGGVLGMVLLLQHLFSLSPSITNVVLDGICFLIGFKVLGGAFARYSIVASLSFAGWYWIWEQFPPLLPDLSAYPLLAAIVGGVFVGVGVGIVVRIGGACGGDDALAMLIAKGLHWPISRAYMFTDFIVLLLSLCYIPPTRTAYSLLTVTISSFLIGQVQKISVQRAPVSLEE